MRNLLKLISRLVFLSVTLIVTPSCQDDEFETHPINGTSSAIFNPDKIYGTLNDQDGNIYKTIIIGTQTWMAENLRTTIYRNGNPIPEVINRLDWENSNAAAYCNPNNTDNADSITTFGRLYNWYAISNTLNIAPKGWHVATFNDWVTLINYLGNNPADKLKETGSSHWIPPNNNATNESGFTALPCIIRSYDGQFLVTYSNREGHWWTSSDFSTQTASDIVIFDNVSTISVAGGAANKHIGFYVRCVKD